jgi:hypothetical protein
MTSRALLAALLCVPGVAAADTPPQAYLELTHDWVRIQSDESGEGNTGRFTVPLGENLFMAGSYAELDAEFEGISQGIFEDFRSRIGGLGWRWAGGDATDAFVLLSYWDASRETTDTDPMTQDYKDDQTGGAVTVGVRYLATPYFTVEPEVTFAHSGDYAFGFGEYVSLKASLRILPHVWAVASVSPGFLSGDEYSTSVGVRLAWSDSVAERKPPAPAALVPFVPGQSLVVQRNLQLQIRPAFGAPETIVVPAGGALSLLETVENAFGTWWRVSHGDQEGWIREGHLR